MFETIFATADSFTLPNVLLASAVSLGLGVIVALVYFIQGGRSKTLLSALILLPVMVEAVILLVNDSLGVGVAVMGTFSLVRFRSAPGSAKDIVCIFFAMVIGIACGTGYLLFAVVIAVIGAVAFVVLSFMPFLKENAKWIHKQLKIVVAEDMDYTTEFDEVFAKYTKSCELKKVKTTNLGSMYELTYSVLINDVKQEKAFIDAIRVRNGNLMVSLGYKESKNDGL